MKPNSPTIECCDKDITRLPLEAISKAIKDLLCKYSGALAKLNRDISKRTRQSLNWTPPGKNPATVEDLVHDLAPFEGLAATSGLQIHVELPDSNSGQFTDIAEGTRFFLKVTDRKTFLEALEQYVEAMDPNDDTVSADISRKVDCLLHRIEKFIFTDFRNGGTAWIQSASALVEAGNDKILDYFDIDRSLLLKTLPVIYEVIATLPEEEVEPLLIRYMQIVSDYHAFKNGNLPEAHQEIVKLITSVETTYN